LPIRSAFWTKGGGSVLLAGRRPFLYDFDVTKGVAMKIPGIMGRGSGRSVDEVRRMNGGGADSSRSHTKPPSLELIECSGGEGGGFKQTIAIGADAGKVILLDGSSYEYRGEVSTPRGSSVRAMAFNENSGNKLLHVAGNGGFVTTFDMRSSRVLGNFISEGHDGSVISSIGVSKAGGNNCLAVGGEDGVVNVWLGNR